MHLLIVEDEEKLARTLARGLEQSGYAIDYYLDGEKAKRHIEINHQDYDLLILDLMLPGENGFEICRGMRERGISMPVIILTARDAVEDKEQALLGCGADDYMVKPFSFRELLARVQALLRRPVPQKSINLSVDDLVIDTATRTVTRSGTKIPLTLKEYSLLEYLMQRPNRVVNREEIFSHVWDYNDNAFSNVIDVHIKNLRKKVDSEHEEPLLETIRGVGYRIRA